MAARTKRRRTPAIWDIATLPMLAACKGWLSEVNARDQEKDVPEMGFMITLS
ncbi:hypothetical protein GCM10008179_21770 [Hansschlegelia plantiphila]|uniref:Uncharacterized protein n=1 Tax=Hansschlegelia plantiphila TaxID=374655 RepID=A0A9W6J358_9HYPH|nr:hypothetical protein GCM10008179_21770 [Hansschlegelia plantiphila]